jgi:SulP family sulfate permease
MNKEAILGRTIKGRLQLFFTFFDSRWEDLNKQNWKTCVYSDFSAGLIVALTAIPLAMGFAIAMGMRPEQGIIAGALACAVGRTFGGSKYQVYGPTAALIPIVAALYYKYGVASGGSAAQAQGLLVFVSIIAGIILLVLGLLGIGKYVKRIPNSIVIGFTFGIAVAIAFSNLGDILGVKNLKEFLGPDVDQNSGYIHKLYLSLSNLHMINWWSVFIGLLTFAITKLLIRISVLIPAPLIAISIATLLSATVLSGKGIILVKDIYGSIPNNFFVFTGPSLPTMSIGLIGNIIYFVIAIVFVSGIESLLCSTMADKMANNKRTKFNPDKELWGQGWVQIIIPIVNGFPCTGALARTATSIKAGAKTPLAGYFKAILKLALAYYLAQYLELIPMACIGGILVWVASNMVNLAEIIEVEKKGRFEFIMMIYTAVMVPATDFFTGVLSALIIYFTTKYIYRKQKMSKILRSRKWAKG